MKLKLLLFMGVFSALSSALSARDKVLSFLPPPNTPPTIVLATGQASELRYCPGSPIANIEIVIGDRETLFKDLVVTFASSNQAYIADSEIAAYPDPATFVTNGQRYLGITGNTIIPPVFVNGFTDITITVTDGDGLTATQVVKILIEDLSIPTIFKTFTGPIASGAIDKTLSSGNCDYKVEDFTGNVTVFDDCTDTPDIVVTQVATLNSVTYNIGQEIPGQDGDVVLVTLTAEDLVGKTATTTFTITLQDETKPELTIILPVVNENLTVDATDCKFTIKDYTQGVFANVSLVEACTPGATITQSPAAGTVVDYFETNQEQTITFNCTDAAGNIADEVSFTVKVKDNTNPTAISLASKTVNLSSTINGGIYTFTGAELNNGSTDNCQIVSYTYLPAFVECDKAGTTVSVTMTVTDLSGNTATSSTDVTVLDVTPPVITVADIEIGTPTCLTLLTTDPKIAVESNLTDNCTVLPTTLIGTRSDDPTKDLFTDPYPFGETTITWTVQDSVGNGATVTQKVTMNDNEFPEFVDATLGVLPSPSPLDQAFFNLSYDSLKDVGSTDVYPAAMLLKPTVDDATDYSLCPPIVNDIPVPVPTPEFLHLGTNTVTWTATDIYGNIVSATQVVTIEDTTIPVITLKDASLLAPFTLDSNGQVVITPADLDNGTTDGFNGNALKLTVVPNTFGCEFVGQDVSLTFFAEDYVGGLVVPDANGVVGDVSHKVYQQITVRIKDATNPTISTSPVVVNTNSACTWNGTLALPTTADNCSVASVTSDKAADFAYPVGVTTVNWTVTDAAGNIATATQTVTVNDVEKPIASAIVKTIQLSPLGTASITAADVNNGSSDNCGIKSLSVSPNTFTCSNVGLNKVTLTVTDNNDNVSTTDTFVTVEDNTAPVVNTQPYTLVLNASGNGSILPSNVDNVSTDICGIKAITVSPNTFTCANVGENTVTLTVTDVNNNVSTGTAIVTVVDSVLPTVLTKNITIQLSASGAASIVASDVNNGSSDSCGVKTVTVSPSSFTCANVGANTVTLTVTDNNNNVQTGTATVTVQDKVAPIVIAKDISLNLNAAGTVSITPADVNDGSADACGIASYALSKSTFNCSNIGLNSVILTATDVNGNVSLPTTVLVTVSDKIAPTVITKNITVQLNAAGTVSIVAADVNNGSTDACGIASYSIDKTSFSCSDTGSAKTVTLTVIDIYGNVGTGTALVTVKDEILPIARTRNITVQLNAAGTVSILPSDINNGSTDNCAIVSYSLSKSTFDCSNVGTNTIALTATDASGNNSIPVDATVIVQDKVAPVVITKPYTAQLDVTGNVTITVANVNNGSTDACGIATYSLSKATFTCANVGSNVITLTATDVNGNINEAFATVTVQDVTAPVVVAKDISLVLDNGSVTIVPEDVLVSATDACGVNIASYSLSKDTFTITDVLASPVTITVYATDINGNIGSDTAILTFPIPITAKQVITPNGDGINDTWEVQNITNNTNSVVRVFNRWGSLVYSAKNYQNDWDGKLNGSDVTVPDGGSYYYQIDLKGTGNVDSEGWLYISRQ